MWEDGGVWGGECAGVDRLRVGRASAFVSKRRGGADLLDEVAHDFAAEDVLGVVPQPEDVVRAQALRHVCDPLALVELDCLAVLVAAAGRDRRERAREEVVEVGGERRFDAVYALSSVGQTSVHVKAPEV